MDTSGRGTRDVWSSSEWAREAKHSGERMVCVCRVAGRQNAREGQSNREGLCDTIRCFTCIPGTDPEIYVSERLLPLSHSRQNTGGLARRRETWKLIARAWTLAWCSKTCVLEQAPSHSPLQSPFVFFLTLITG